MVKRLGGVLSSAAHGLFPSYRKLSAPGKLSQLTRKKNPIGIAVEISSNLPLQILLYCTVWLYPVWIATSATCVGWKLLYYGVVDFHRFMIICLFIIFTLVEPLRLWFGYSGNLLERIPDLAGFFLLSCFPQLPIALYFIFFQPISIFGFSLPIDIGINVTYGTIILFQIIGSYLAGQNIIASHAAQFVLRQERS